jgi:hypothetical protein
MTDEERGREERLGIRKRRELSIEKEEEKKVVERGRKRDRHREKESSV